MNLVFYFRIEENQKSPYFKYYFFFVKAFSPKISSLVYVQKLVFNLGILLKLSTKKENACRKCVFNMFFISLLINWWGLMWFLPPPHTEILHVSRAVTVDHETSKQSFSYEGSTKKSNCIKHFKLNIEAHMCLTHSIVPHNFTSL